ncbi:MAG: ABC transporter permease [Acidobacteria bacterium]|nr:ABC transporter permease [Acidobacteriota bacterium]
MLWKPFGRKRREQELDDEINAHLEMEIRQRIDRGESAEQARANAHRDFGNVGLVKDVTRDAWGGISLLQDLSQDTRYALRTFRRNPVFTAVVILSLALGIGANTALFSVFDAKLLRKLPVRNPDELVYFNWVSESWTPRDFSGTLSQTIGEAVNRASSPSFPYAVFERFQADRDTLFAAFALTLSRETTAIVDTEPERVRVNGVSGNYFAALGIPILGRAIGVEDDQLSATPVAVISHAYWERRFASDARVIGKTLIVNRVPVTIIGITPPEFRASLFVGGLAPDLSVPLSLQPAVHGRPVNYTTSGLGQTWFVQIMARMKPGVTPEQVRGRLEPVFQDITRQTRTADPRDIPRLEVWPGSRGFENPSQRITQLLATLWGVVGLLLVLVCLNIAALHLARSAARQYEIGIRLASGANRFRIVRQLVTESVVAASAGSLIGILLTYTGKDALRVFLAEEADLIRVDGHVLAFALAMSLVTPILFGLVPALQATRMDVNSAIKRNSRIHNSPRSLLSKALLVTQVAISVVLLIGAGLLLRTLGRVPAADVGFDTTRLLLFQLDTSFASRDYDRARIAGLYDQIMQRINALPGVLGSTMANEPLVSTSRRFRDVRSHVSAVLPDETVVDELTVGPNFFEVFRIPIRAGRPLSRQDLTPVAGAASRPRGVVINESFARRFFGDRDAVGTRMTLGFPGTLNTLTHEVEIVGVAKDVAVNTVLDSIPPTVFLPGLGNYFAVRTEGDPLLFVPVIRQVIAEVHTALRVTDIKTQDQQVLEGFQNTRLLSLACIIFGGVALFTTSIGLFGLMSYNVARRTGEIGVRMALGARRLDIFDWVMRQTLIVVGIGLLIGLPAAFALNRMIRSLIYGVSLYDPLTLAAVIAITLGTSVLAAFLPARRASSIDPAVALRLE